MSSFKIAINKHATSKINMPKAQDFIKNDESNSMHTNVKDYPQHGPIENEPVDGAIILERRKQESRMERMNQVLGTDIGSEQQTDTCIDMDMDV